MEKPNRQKKNAQSNPFILSRAHQPPSMADNPVMEERNELMVSPTGRHECFRTAHFLTPSAASTDGAAAPSPDSSSSAPDSAIKYKDLPFRADFVGWRFPQENWKTWVNRMKSLHRSTWEKVGIFDAIMSSTYSIQRKDVLIFGFVEKWCPATNSFVFSWGEATITLEDVMVLGGYSVLGEFVSSPGENGEMEEIVKKLLSARSDICLTKAKKADQSRWIAKFMGSESEIEHEAFLAYWLSRFVFPRSPNVVERSVLPIAARLATGTKVALAPAILACIYNNLTLLNEAIFAARNSGKKKSQKNVCKTTVVAPLALVQVWIWERFPSLQPKPNSIGNEQPRLARWNNMKTSSIVDMEHKINSAAENFQWRPYLKPLSNFHGKIYKDNEYRGLIGPDLDEQLQKLVKCLRPSELIGIESNYIEQYLPHRVAMQFGFDQDIPSHVECVNSNPEFAWSDYSLPIRDTKLYIPSRLSEPCVTTRYLKWWKKLNLGRNVITEDTKVEKLKDNFVPQQMADIRQGLSEKSCKSSKRKMPDYSACVSPPPGFSPKRSPSKKSESGFGVNETGLMNPCEEDGLEKNHITSAECSQNNGVNPSQVQSSTSDSEVLTRFEGRIKNVEKLCAWIKSGKLVCPR